MDTYQNSFYGFISLPLRYSVKSLIELGSILVQFEFNRILRRNTIFRTHINPPSYISTEKWGVLPLVYDPNSSSRSFLSEYIDYRHRSASYVCKDCWDSYCSVAMVRWDRFELEIEMESHSNTSCMKVFALLEDIVLSA